MVVGVEENTASESGFESEEFFVPEFGRVNLTWFDLSRKYRGAIFRLGQDVSKQISDIVGFSANFEAAGIRTACIDLFKTEGHCVFEIERNTKPTDLAVRYSRERWNLLDATGKAGDTLRPWIKTEYRAKYVADKILGLVAEQLKMQPDNAGNFVFRINFREKTFGLICEERFAEQMPTGSFSPFSLPSEAMLALAKTYGKLEEEQAGAETELSLNRTPEDIKTDGTTARVPANETAGSDRPASINAASDQCSDATATTTNAASAQNSEASSSPKPTLAASPSSESKQESPAAIQKEAAREEAEALPGSTKSLDKFIQRKADRPVEKTEQRREPVESSSAKYATYSRSEVDQMLKQQTENITSALGSKISSQQRVFQEAVERQEKSFAKLSDGFVTQFDATRVRLESASKQSEENIHNELDGFKKDLSKELEQYRAQINKTVVPVAKFIEDKNAKTPEKAQKEVSPAKAQQSQASADNHGMRTMLVINIGLMLLTLAALFMIFMPVLTKVDELQSKLDSINSRLSSPATHQGTQGTSKSTSADNKAGNGAGNLSGIGDNTHPVTPSGSNSTAPQ